MQELLRLLAARDESVPLDVAALDLATIEYTQLDPAAYVALLDSYARELGERVPAAAGGAEFVRIANQYLFQELGLSGNETDYYNPANSCLNAVLASRRGIPITLAVIYLEIGRRLGRPTAGIGLPGHFILNYDDGDFAAFIDVFHQGRLLDAPACFELARRITGRDFSRDPEALAPVGKRQILIRMLHNLRVVYFRRQDWRRAVDVLTCLIQGNPGSAEEYKQRAIGQAQMRRYRAAINDLERYLELAPDAADRDGISRQLDHLRHSFATLN